MYPPASSTVKVAWLLHVQLRLYVMQCHINALRMSDMARHELIRYVNKIKHDAKQHWHGKLKSDVYFFSTKILATIYCSSSSLTSVVYLVDKECISLLSQCILE